MLFIAFGPVVVGQAIEIRPGRILDVAHSFGTGLTLGALVQLIGQNQAVGIDGVVRLGAVLNRPAFRSGVLSLPVWILRLLRPWLTPACGGEALAWHLTNADFQVLAQCGHQPMLERPEQVLNAITRMLETTATERGAAENA